MPDLETGKSSRIVLKSLQGTKVGDLDDRHSRMLRAFHGESRIELQWTMVIVMDSVNSSARKRRSKHNSHSYARISTLSVSIYGENTLFEKVGKFLTDYQLYLQRPTVCGKNVPYRNPQSLIWRDESSHIPLGDEKPGASSNIEDVDPTVDPARDLECEHFMPETNAPAIIRTPLLRYAIVSPPPLTCSNLCSVVIKSKHCHSCSKERRGGILRVKMRIFGRLFRILFLLCDSTCSTSYIILSWLTQADMSTLLHKP